MTFSPGALKNCRNGWMESPIIQETALFEEYGDLQQLGFQPIRFDAGRECRNGVRAAFEVELVLEHVGGVGNVEGAVRAGAGGLGREGHAGLDDLAERVAM